MFAPELVILWRITEHCDLGCYFCGYSRRLQPILTGLEGRPPVIFRAADGRPINNVDVSIALRPFAIAQFNLHQFADGSLRLRLRGPGADHDAIRRALLGLFGPDQPLTIEDIAVEGKVVQYTSDLKSLLSE